VFETGRVARLTQNSTAFKTNATTYTLDALKSEINSTRAADFLKPLQSPIDFLNNLPNPAFANLSIQTVESSKSYQPTRSLNFFYKKQLAAKIDREN
jgi:hypothetical protein